jgi:osmotically-inducible protein OsmY
MIFFLTPFPQSTIGDIMTSPSTQAINTDAVTREKISHLLHCQNFPMLRRLDIEAEDGTVTLKGSLRTFHEKQIALTVSTQVQGVDRLVDEIVVQQFRDTF